MNHVKSVISYPSSWLLATTTTPSKREKVPDWKGATGNSRKFNAKETHPDPKQYAHELVEHVGHCHPSTFEINS